MILAALIAAAATIFVAVRLQDDSEPTPSRQPAGQPAGQMLHPKRSQQVARAFTVDGVLSAIPQDDHVWVAVQIGNLLFPKEPEVSASDKRFSVQVVEGGSPPGGKFSLALLMVDSDGQQTIEEWIERGRRGEGSPGFDGIQGSVKLDIVENLDLR